jgi:hypothetical protein
VHRQPNRRRRHDHSDATIARVIVNPARVVRRASSVGLSAQALARHSLRR